LAEAEGRVAAAVAAYGGMAGQKRKREKEKVPEV
jgi:hypothetical protein